VGSKGGAAGSECFGSERDKHDLERTTIHIRITVKKNKEKEGMVVTYNILGGK
jgi:hypothetical protein